MTKENSVFRRLSVAAFARSAAQMEGVEPLASFRRLADGAQGDVSHAVVRWSARGEIRSPPGGFEQVWLHLVVRAGLPKICQRCLGPLEVELCVDRWFRFVADEATAAAQDEQVEEDLLVLSREFDIAGLIEDELVMEMPLVPKHGQCPLPLAPTTSATAGDAMAGTASDAKPNPFAVLAKLRLL